MLWRRDAPAGALGEGVAVAVAAAAGCWSSAAPLGHCHAVWASRPVLGGDWTATASRCHRERAPLSTGARG